MFTPCNPSSSALTIWDAARYIDIFVIINVEVQAKRA